MTALRWSAAGGASCSDPHDAATLPLEHLEPPLRPGVHRLPRRHSRVRLRRPHQLAAAGRVSVSRTVGELESSVRRDAGGCGSGAACTSARSPRGARPPQRRGSGVQLQRAGQVLDRIARRRGRGRVRRRSRGRTTGHGGSPDRARRRAVRAASATSMRALACPRRRRASTTRHRLLRRLHQPAQHCRSASSAARREAPRRRGRERRRAAWTRIPTEAAMRTPPGSRPTVLRRRIRPTVCVENCFGDLFCESKCASRGLCTSARAPIDALPGSLPMRATLISAGDHEVGGRTGGMQLVSDPRRGLE